MAKTVVGLYHDTEHARQAVQDLVDLGIPRTDISLMSRQEAESKGYTTGTAPMDTEHRDATPNTATDESAAAGAGVGAVVGGVGGLLVGMGLLVIPGIGPILAAGPLVAALTGAALGAGVGALVGALVGMGVPEEEAQYYAEGVRRGGTLVAVNSPDHQVSQVMDVLKRHEPVDIKRQAMAWREAGWKGYDPNAQPLTREELDRERSTWAPVQHDTMREHERETVGTQTAGRMYEGQTPKRDRDTMTPSNTGLSTPSGTSTRMPHDDRTTVAHGEKAQTHTEDPTTVAHGERTTTPYGTDSSTHYGTDMTRQAPRQGGMGTTKTQHTGRPWTDYETDFRRDFERRWKGTNATWEKYEPAYHYAYDTANDPRYRDRQWNDVEADLRRDWEYRHGDTLWDEVKDAVRDAWDRVRGYK